MKRAYEIKVENGDNVYGGNYVVVAASDEVAVRKAKAQAASETGVKRGWRCTGLNELRSTTIVG